MKELVRKKRRQLIKIARELGYTKEVIAKLEEAETEEEANRIMEQARLTATD